MRHLNSYSWFKTNHFVCVLQPVPALLEIPSKDNPYDPNQDSLLLRVKHLLGLS